MAHLARASSNKSFEIGQLFHVAGDENPLALEKKRFVTRITNIVNSLEISARSYLPIEPRTFARDRYAELSVETDIQILNDTIAFLARRDVKIGDLQQFARYAGRDLIITQVKNRFTLFTYNEMPISSAAFVAS